jgi:hypothetical protein
MKPECVPVAKHTCLVLVKKDTIQSLQKKEKIAYANMMFQKALVMIFLVLAMDCNGEFIEKGKVTTNWAIQKI